MQLVHSVLPPVIAGLIGSVVEELYGKINFSIISISAVTLLWSAARGIKSIGHGVRNIFGSRSKSGFIQNIVYSLLLTVAFVIFMIAAISFIVFGRMIIHYLSERFTLSPALLNLFFALRLPLFFAVLVILFWMAYQGMARLRCKWRTHLPGAVLAAAGWVIFSWLYSLYIDNYADYSYVYGSLAAVVLLMLWLYFCMVIFLCGAEINKLLLLRRERQNDIVIQQKESGDRT